jgi:hypothetical protein
VREGRVLIDRGVRVIIKREVRGVINQGVRDSSSIRERGKGFN